MSAASLSEMRWVKPYVTVDRIILDSGPHAVAEHETPFGRSRRRHDHSATAHSFRRGTPYRNHERFVPVDFSSLDRRACHRDGARYRSEVRHLKDGRAMRGVFSI